MGRGRREVSCFAHSAESNSTSSSFPQIPMTLGRRFRGHGLGRSSYIEALASMVEDYGACEGAELYFREDSRLGKSGDQMSSLPVTA